MGYHTEFRGEFRVTPALSRAHREYLSAFSEIRHMRRDATCLEGVPDPLRQAVGLPVGVDGAYFIGPRKRDRAGCNDPTVLDHSCPPSGQPGLWCKWTPSPDGRALYWDGSEKFYNYVEWLEYLSNHFLRPWGYVLDGDVEWCGEDEFDYGVVRVSSGVIRVVTGILVADPARGKRRLRVFLAHAKEDRELARSIYDDLVSDGISPWLDEKDLVPGQDWALEITEALRSSDVVLVLVSSKAVTKRGYFQKEIRRAIDFAEYEPEGAIYVIPVLLEDCPVPTFLEKWQWVRLYEADGYARLLGALRIRAEQLSGFRT